MLFFKSQKTQSFLFFLNEISWVFLRIFLKMFLFVKLTLNYYTLKFLKNIFVKNFTEFSHQNFLPFLESFLLHAWQQR